MFSSPANPQSPFVRECARYVVLLGAADGSAPTVDDETKSLNVMEFSGTAGFGQVDAAKFSVDMKLADLRLVDTTVPIGYKRQIEVRRLDEEGEPSEIVFWGVIAGQPQKINRGVEGVWIDARIDKHLFGNPLTDVPYWDPRPDVDPEETIIDCDLPLVFNPEIDEIIENNRSDKSAADDLGAFHPFLHPESVRLGPARTYQQQIRSAWTVTEAVLMLCWHLNPDETYIENPKRDELLTAFADIDGSGFLKNVHLKFGRFLPELLDDLLRPWGYSWYLKHALEDDQRKTKIHFYKRGKGSLVSVRMQRPGERIDSRKTNLSEVDINYNIVELANKITVLGDYIQREATWLLKKGWADSDDGIDQHELERGHTTATAKPYVWRKWVLNEAGDYNDLRPEITEPEDLESILEAPTLVRRRRFLKCLSRHEDTEEAESNGVRVDWWDESQTGAVTHEDPEDAGWVKVKWPYSVLQKECGILFEGPLPPDELHAAGDEAYVRVTATIVGDRRIKGEAARQQKSPNGRDLELVLETRDRFHDRAVDGTSIFADQDLADTVNDQTKITQYAEKIRDLEDCATVSTQLYLDGVDHPEYEIGQLIDKIDGRNLTLNANNPKTGEPRRLQIVGLSHRLHGEQRLQLLLETYDPELADERRGIVA